MPVNVDPTTLSDSTHHLSLEDSAGTKVGLICVDGKGNRIPRVNVNPYPNMASQLRQGRGKHADRVPPFEDIPQSDFSGGLASLHFDEDSSKYLDGKRCDTTRPGEVVHSGLETYTTGLRDFNQNWSTNVNWLSMYASPGTESKSTSFVANATYNVESIVVILKRVGDPAGNVTVTLLDSSDTQVGTATKALKIKPVRPGIPRDTDILPDFVSERVEFVLPSVEGITDTTTYKVNVAYSGGDATNYIQVAIDDSDALCYRVLDDTDDIDGIPFELNGGMYFMTQPLDRSVSKLYLYGDRGVADSNTAALTTLIDGTKSWTNDEWIGGVVKIVAEDGTEEREPYRSITDNNGTTLTVSPAWKIDHTTETEYVILYPKWQLVQTLSQYCKSVTVGKYYAVFAVDGAGSARYEVMEDAGAYNETLYQSGTYAASHVLASNGDIIGGGRQDGGTLYDIQSDTTFSTIGKRRMPVRADHDIRGVLPIGLLEKAEPFNDTVGSGVTSYVNNGRVYIKMTGNVTGDIVHRKLDSPVDISDARYIKFFFISVAALSAGDLQFGVSDGTNRVNVDFPAVSANTSTWVEIELTTPPGADTYDESAITDIYIKSTVAVNSIMAIFKDKPIIQLVPHGEYYADLWTLPVNTKVNNMVEYSGGAGEVSSRPWIFTWAGPWYLSGSNFVKLYLGELEELEHPDNGRGVCVNDVYIYFNLGGTIQRYYAGHLDNVGPDADYGLPANRVGIPITAASYPGRVFFGIDAGEYTNTGAIGGSGTKYSSVIVRRSHGWNEFYRAPGNKRIRSIHAYARADSVDQLFVLEGADILWLPLSINPQKESDYEYAHESVLETSRIYAGLRETDKYFHAMTLITENLYSGGQYIEVDYRVAENTIYGATEWANVGKYTISPRQRIRLSTDNDVSGRWIQFRIRSYTEDKDECPMIVSYVLDALERLNVNDTYSYTIGLKEGIDKDLRGGNEDRTGVATLTQLETWVDDPKPLTLNTSSAFENDKLVFIEGMTKRVRYSKIGNKEQETRIVNLTLIEVS